MLTDTSSSLAQRTDGMGFIHIEISLVLLADGYDLWKLADVTFHGVDAFDDDKDLLPRTTKAWLTLGDGLDEDFLQVRGSVVLENFHLTTGGQGDSNKRGTRESGNGAP